MNVSRALRVTAFALAALMSGSALASGEGYLEMRSLLMLAAMVWNTGVRAAPVVGA